MKDFVRPDGNLVFDYTLPIAQPTNANELTCDTFGALQAEDEPRCCRVQLSAQIEVGGNVNNRSPVATEPRRPRATETRPPAATDGS